MINARTILFPAIAGCWISSAVLLIAILPTHPIGPHPEDVTFLFVAGMAAGFGMASAGVLALIKRAIERSNSPT
jgi:hypothetical protein